MKTVPILLALVACARTTSYTITVGNAQNGQEFAPEWLQDVTVGDLVVFNFTVAGHSVAQTSLAAPCTFLNGGFASGKNMPAGGSLTIQVTDVSGAIFFADPLADHCRSGAAGAINGGEFQEEFVANLADAIGGGFDKLPMMGTPIGSGERARVVQLSSLPDSSPVGAGTIAGVVAVSVLLLVAIGFIIRHWFVIVRRRRAQKRTEWKKRLEGRLQDGAATGHGSSTDIHVEVETTVTRERGREARASKDFKNLEAELPRM